MIIVEPNYRILTAISKEGVDELSRLEEIARVCYKSENLIASGSAKKLITSLIKRGHGAMLEHGTISVLFTVDRGVSHELVRHRLASFAQESTRYCNYAKDKFSNQITCINPNFEHLTGPSFEEWKRAMRNAEESYFNLLEEGWTPQEARTVLPTSLKTDIVITANYREWLTILALRTDITAHPQMRQIMIPLAEDLKKKIPTIFNHIGVRI